MYAGREMAMCIEQVELALSHPAMVCADLDALQERHESVIQRIIEFEETLLRPEKRSLS